MTETASLQDNFSYALRNSENPAFSPLHGHAVNQPTFLGSTASTKQFAIDSPSDLIKDRADTRSETAPLQPFE